MVLEEEAIREALAERTLVGAGSATIEVHPLLGSTNDRARELADAGAAAGSLVVARRQEAGRGRLGRAWASPAGGLYASILLRPDDSLLRLIPITLLAGLAVAEAIDAATGLRTDLKWPNDVQIGGRKVAGVLGELHRANGRNALVLGVGINVTGDPAELPEEVQATATSVAEHAPAPDFAALLGRVAERFEVHYEAVQRGGAGAILAAVSARMTLLGEPCRVRVADRVIVGKATGLDATGALLLELADGTTEVILAGEAERLRGDEAGAGA